MKLKITIESTRYEENIIEICIKNGNWKYWDTHMETEEPITLTMNNIHDASYLAQPVKDEIKHYDHELYRETGELKEKGKPTTRTYDSLHEYLVCRINNAKEDYKSLGNISEDWKHYKYECVLFEEEYVKLDEQEIGKDINYKTECGLIVRIDIE